MPRRRIDPKVDVCVHGHIGHWRKNSVGAHVCGICINEYHRVEEHRKRARNRQARIPLILAYRAVPGAVKKAAELLHMKPKKAYNFIHGYRHAPRWRVTQLKAVLELCILGNGNGHKSEAGLLPLARSENVAQNGCMGQER